MSFTGYAYFTGLYNPGMDWFLNVTRIATARLFLSMVFIRTCISCICQHQGRAHVPEQYELNGKLV